MTLASDLRRHGLYLRGSTRVTDAEIATCGLPAERRLLALVGNIGSSYWPAFSRSPEYTDGAADPLDRWSRRIAGQIASKHALEPVFPFDGPPYLPFQQWASRAEGLAASPLGILIHPEHGLWHSYRFALLGEAIPGAPQPVEARSPCHGCKDRPCLGRCPVGAFDGSGYDVDRCADYLRRDPQAACHDSGCLARYACPVAPALRYLPQQGRFHLRAFLDAR